jgi:hypothetical protein
VRSARIGYLRGWLDSLSDSDYKHLDEVCGMLAEKGTELGGGRASCRLPTGPEPCTPPPNLIHLSTAQLILSSRFLITLVLTELI